MNQDIKNLMKLYKRIHTLMSFKDSNYWNDRIMALIRDRGELIHEIEMTTKDLCDYWKELDPTFDVDDGPDDTISLAEYLDKSCR